MAGGTTFSVKGFDHVGGRLVATISNAARSQVEALLQAEALARRLPGAAAFAQRTRDDGTAAQTILGAFGDVPDEVSEGLAGG